MTAMTVCVVLLLIVLFWYALLSFGLVAQVSPAMPLLAPPSTSAAPVASVLTITQTGNRFVLTGTAPSEAAKKKLTNAAASLYGPDGFTDAVKVDASTPGATWWNDPKSILPPASFRLGSKSIVFRSDSVNLEGDTPSADEHSGYVARVEQAALGMTVQDNIHVDAPKAEEPKAVQADLDQNVLKSTIEFETNSAVLSAAGQKVCKVVAEKLGNVPELNVEVDGFTDNVGSESRNLALSQSRAESVCDYLSLHGVARSRLSAKGFGSQSPVASNDTAEGRFRNRRIGFKVRG